MNQSKHNSGMKKGLYFHFIDEETEAPREATCSLELRTWVDHLGPASELLHDLGMLRNLYLCFLFCKMVRIPTYPSS